MIGMSFSEAVILNLETESGFLNSLLGPLGALPKKLLERMGLINKKLVDGKSVSAKETVSIAQLSSENEVEFQTIVVAAKKAELMVMLFRLLTSESIWRSFDGGKNPSDESIISTVQQLEAIRVKLLNSKHQRLSDQDRSNLPSFLLPMIEKALLSEAYKSGAYESEAKAYESEAYKKNYTDVLSWLNDNLKIFADYTGNEVIDITGLSFIKLPNCLKKLVAKENYEHVYNQLQLLAKDYFDLSSNREKLSDFYNSVSVYKWRIPGYISLHQFCFEIIKSIKPEEKFSNDDYEDAIGLFGLYGKKCNIAFFHTSVVEKLTANLKGCPVLELDGKIEGIFDLIHTSYGYTPVKKRHKRWKRSSSGSGSGSDTAKEDTRDSLATVGVFKVSEFEKKSKRPEFEKFLSTKSFDEILSRITVERHFARFLVLNRDRFSDFMKDKDDFQAECVVVALRFHNSKHINAILSANHHYQNILDQRLPENYSKKESKSDANQNNSEHTLLQLIHLTNEDNENILDYLLMVLIKHQHHIAILLVSTEAGAQLLSAIIEINEENFNSVVTYLSTTSDRRIASIMNDDPDLTKFLSDYEGGLKNNY